MPEARQLKIEDSDEPIKISKNLKEHLENTITDELIIGLCGPIGTDIKYVSQKLKDLIQDSFNYECIEIKLSDYIKEQETFEKTTRNFEYYDGIIKKGNNLRKNRGNDILSKYAINEIAKNRVKKSDKINGSEDLVYSKRICYIINSIKHIDEYRLLKKVYQNIFYFVGVFSPLEVRKRNMENNRIEKPDIEKLISVDSDQKESYGQKVSKTFMNSDYFLRIEDSHDEKINDKLLRFLDLIFGTKIITPSIDETAMYQASSAAANSACMSRQVGAAITNSKGDLISVGWNDVPKAGGNLYTSNSQSDHRCINKDGGKCFNDSEKKLLIDLISEELIKQNAIEKKQIDKVKETLEDTRIKDLLEFSRAVHAEMHAIINATSKSGSEIINGKLYCTTYPCHNCARHIVASGISEVYYIEPYSKSLALKLHGDSITERTEEDNRVKILMYDGVSPSRYIDLFKILEGHSRKKNGSKILTPRKSASPRKSISLDAIPYLEQKATQELHNLSILDNKE